MSVQRKHALSGPLHSGREKCVTPIGTATEPQNSRICAVCEERLPWTYVMMPIRVTHSDAFFFRVDSNDPHTGSLRSSLPASR